jgi:hypothetical protein
VRDLGKNTDLVRTLARIQGLTGLVISGFCAKPWPAYLEEQLGVRARARCGFYLEERIWDGNSDREHYEKELERRRTRNKNRLQLFNIFQQGTEDLVP